MEYTEVSEQLRKVIQPLFDEAGLELIELNFSRSRFAAALSILADRIGGGITIDDCAMLNRKIGELLDASELIAEKYTLEVSSPGIDRQLKTKNDFLRCMGKDVKFFLREAINGKIEVDGKVLEVNEETVKIQAKKESLSIPLLGIAKAKQIIN